MTSGLARPGASSTARCARFVLRRLVVDRATMAAVARELGRSWDTIDSIAVEATTELLATAGPARPDDVQVLGVDEHRWAHTCHAAGDGFVTVIVDLTPVVAQTRPGAAAGPGRRPPRPAGRPRHRERAFSSWAAGAAR